MKNAKASREHERYYLLPGMGGRARRKKVVEMIGWGVLGGAVTSLLLAIALYVFSRISLNSM
jgi:hypothetical protein